MVRSAVVLASGGLDSTTCIAIAREEGFDVTTLSFDYGQRHKVELAAAERVRRHYGIARHYDFDIGLFRTLGGSALTADIDVPHNRAAAAMGSRIPVTYVPARNLVFLSYALGVADRVGAADIFIGVNAVDYSGYPDCRPEFIEAFQLTANLAVKSSVEGSGVAIRAPLVRLSKSEIIQLGTRLNVPYHLTHSCYDPSPDGVACGSCDSCLLRLKGFADTGLRDPVPYVAASGLGAGEGLGR